ncbi:MAG: pilus assembly protein TadB [Acidobacteria bacterium]|nr:pilus assembly protein TadB [Acidobacteriota bacterium]
MTLLPLVTFVLLFAGIYTAYWAFVLRPEQEITDVARRRLRAGKTGTSESARRSAILKQMEALSSIGSMDAMLRRSQNRVLGLQTLIHQSGARVTVGTVLAASATLGLLTLVIAHGVLSSGLGSVPGGSLYTILGALAAAAMALMAPVATLRFMRTRRMRRFEEQFPEALDLLSRALKAGHAFTTGIDMVGTEMPQPVGPEFRNLYDHQNFGMPMPDALKAFSERVPVLDARFFVTAVLIQRESGGNLSEVLDNLAGVIRERFRVKRQMRVISAHGRITGLILVCLPPVLGFVLMTVNPEHRRTMLGDPLGIQMLAGAVVLQIVGTLIIRKIVNVEY